ncbi:putative Two-component sensor histidine kinase [Sulfurovum sp. enrichment culture clone C5]|uniref:histidine kinase n=1 Tax=Sulfurovum sp. enrichment culture clone C5 TaxID=497650 RepID=A0A0S4XLX0_9BACT|nr:putative Two-component sensor histidine kinase [Sulfurovum sp. enrichment culture clone C5]
MSLIFILGFLLIASMVASIVIYINFKKLQKEIDCLNEWIMYPKITEKKEYENTTLNEIQEEVQKLMKQSQKRKSLKIKMDAKLKLKNRQRNDMIAALAHEFRNPIASIIGYATTIQEDKNIDPDIRDRFLSKIYNNSQKIESLLSRLILWNRFENGQATFNLESFSIMPLLNEVKNSLLEKYPYRVINIHGDDRAVKADKILLEIVIKNLTENAIKYSKDDVNIFINPETIEIVDSGVGISEQNLEKVTKKFFRSGEHSWDNSMGLGLSIVKKILDMHGSELKIESQLDKGSSFSFEI